VSEKKLREMIEKNVPGLLIILSVFAIIEFGILIVCVLYSSNQDVVKIYNANSEIVYEDSYNLIYINEFKKLSGIKNFKKEGYVVTRIGVDNKFPTRSWIALSICVPLVLVLFIVFIVRVFEDVFHSKKEEEPDDKKANEELAFDETKFEKLFSTLGRLNIYSLGSTIIVGAFLYWMVPDLLLYVGKISYQTVTELKWVLLAVILFLGVYVLLKVYLSYKTKTEIIKQQAHIQQNRDALAIEAKTEKNLLEDKSTGIIDN
jgi:NADH:ubiquinone oxidoreductase subunit 5 (subunit L)/multisubunit Na+/H+ antiporter MnhA subunit